MLVMFRLWMVFDSFVGLVVWFYCIGVYFFVLVLGCFSVVGVFCYLVLMLVLGLYVVMLNL